MIPDAGIGCFAVARNQDFIRSAYSVLLPEPCLGRPNLVLGISTNSVNAIARVIVSSHGPLWLLAGVRVCIKATCLGLSDLKRAHG
jgi:hypothetical protein